MLRRVPPAAVLALALGLSTVACSDTQSDNPTNQGAQGGDVTATTRESSGSASATGSAAALDGPDGEQ